MNFDEAMKEMEGVFINLNELPFTAFEVWFEDQDFYTNMRFIHGDKLFDKDGGAYRVLPVQMVYQGWSSQRQRSKGEFISITQEWHSKGWNARQGEIDDLRQQLNNMEQCYIGKKKQVEDALSRIEGLMVHAVADYENTKSTSMMCAVQGVEKALRGAND